MDRHALLVKGARGSQVPTSVLCWGLSNLTREVNLGETAKRTKGHVEAAEKGVGFPRGQTASGIALAQALQWLFLRGT